MRFRVKRFNLLPILTAVFFILIGCSADKIVEQPLECDTNVTYIGHIKPILDNSCAYAGCHVVSFRNGDYTKYSSMERDLLSGKFERWVVKDRDMPPLIVPDGKPTELTEEQLNLLKCWKENGYAEK